MRGSEGGVGGGELKDDTAVLAVCAVDWYAGVHAIVGQRLKPDEVRVRVQVRSSTSTPDVVPEEVVIERGAMARTVVSMFLPAATVEGA